MSVCSTNKKSDLALHGGQPVRRANLPYGRHWISPADIAAVTKVLESDWLTTGPKVREFERALADFVGAREAVAVSSGTAALHAAGDALRIGPGDEVVVPAMTFAATANCVVYCGGTPVFADVCPRTLLINPADAEAKMTARTKAVIAVDYAGQPCDYGQLKELTGSRQIALIADGCHALGAAVGETPVGSLADLTAFSLHPVKHITSGEGGAVTTNDQALAERMRRFRNHGINLDARNRETKGTWIYEITDLGYNYRLTDFQCALAASQLQHLPEWIARRRQIARRYDTAFAELAGVRPLATRAGITQPCHLYVVEHDLERLAATRTEMFHALRAEGIGVNVHYVPVHLHPFYQQRFGTRPGLCPTAERLYERILSLPIFPLMQDSDVEDVVTAMQ